MAKSTNPTQFQVSKGVFNGSLGTTNFSLTSSAIKNLKYLAKFLQQGASQMLLALSRKKKRTNCLIADSLACLDQKSFRGPCGDFWHHSLASEPGTKAVNYAGAIFNSKKYSDGREMLVWLCERGTKTRPGQENVHQCSFQPKIYATGSGRCAVK